MVVVIFMIIFDQALQYILELLHLKRQNGYSLKVVSELRSVNKKNKNKIAEQNHKKRCYLSHHMFPIDESFKPTYCCRIIQWEDVLCLNGHRAQIGVFLEDDDLIQERGDVKRETYHQCFI